MKYKKQFYFLKIKKKKYTDIENNKADGVQTKN